MSVSILLHSIASISQMITGVYVLVLCPVFVSILLLHRFLLFRHLMSYFYVMFDYLIRAFSYDRITLVQRYMLTISMLLYLEINQLLQVGVGKLWIVVPMIIFLYTTLIMEVQGFLVGNSNFFS